MSKPDIEAVPHSLYPTHDSLSHCFQRLSGELPIHQPNQLKAALLSYQNTLLKTLDPSVNGRETIETIAKAKYPDKTFDTALPQDWVHNMQSRGFDPRGHFVTLYPTSSNFDYYMAPITPEGVEMAARVATHEA